VCPAVWRRSRERYRSAHSQTLRSYKGNKRSVVELARYLIKITEHISSYFPLGAAHGKSALPCGRCSAADAAERRGVDGMTR
jgi:hypothetical protein